MSTKLNEAPSLSKSFSDPLDFLIAVMNDRLAPTDIRIDAAEALLPFFHVPLNAEQDE
jgi:phage terminase small subunit